MGFIESDEVLLFIYLFICIWVKSLPLSS